VKRDARIATNGDCYTKGNKFLGFGIERSFGGRCLMQIGKTSHWAGKLSSEAYHQALQFTAARGIICRHFGISYPASWRNRRDISRVSLAARHRTKYRAMIASQHEEGTNGDVPLPVWAVLFF
jgi:hypothetical protein